jgi:IS30 family transposase
VAEIADWLYRDASTIYREIKRNSCRFDDQPELNGYHALAAQDKCEERRAIHRKLVIYPEIMAAVRSGFDAGWSPEQIAGRMRLERHPIRVSHETIYRYAYSKDGRAEKFCQHLPRHRRNRRPRGMRKHHGSQFLEELAIRHRPKAVGEGVQFGHWECDLVMFRKEFGKANVTSLVERVSRFAVVLKNPDRQSKPVMEGFVDPWPRWQIRRCLRVRLRPHSSPRQRRCPDPFDLKPRVQDYPRGDHREQTAQRCSGTYQNRTGQGAAKGEGQTNQRQERLREDGATPTWGSV